MKRIKIGVILIYISIFVTFILWISAKESLSEIISSLFISLNQISALLGSILFVWSMILATRLDFLENLFGGLDKVYKIHRKVSILGAVLILLHPLTLSLSSIKRGIYYFLPVHNKTSVNLGVYSFWIFVIAILLTLFVRKIKLPYHLWKQTHKFLNLAMLVALLHVVTIQSDTSSFSPLGIWMNILIGLGVASGLYKTFFYNKFGPKYEYKIIKINRYSDIHDIYLKPTIDKLPHKIAQYVYVSFISDRISKEEHPYCITSLPEDDSLRLSIKELGDYTKKLGSLKVGDRALIYGPYGQLGKNFNKHNMDSIFIGGGIGIAPFLSMFKKAGLTNNGALTSLFYCTKYKKDAVFEKELEELAETHENLNYCNQCSREIHCEHLSVKQISELVRNIKRTNVYLCGPTRMMVPLSKDLVYAGFSKDNIILEDFEML